MKKLISYTLTILLGLVLSSGSCSTDGFDTDPAGGVTINGVIWAKCNVDSPGNFTPNPGTPGKFYQWNRSTAYSALNPLTPAWNATFPSTSWSESSNVCPFGWRLPTKLELESLLDATKVKHENKSQNGSDGFLFTDLSTKKSVFIPCSGWREAPTGELIGRDIIHLYWSSVYAGSEAGVHKSYAFTSFGFGAMDIRIAGSIRCVKN